MKKEPQLYTYKGVIGTFDVLKIFVTGYTGYTFLKRATAEEAERWKKVN